MARGWLHNTKHSLSKVYLRRGCVRVWIIHLLHCLGFLRVFLRVSASYLSSLTPSLCIVFLCFIPFLLTVFFLVFVARAFVGAS